MISLLLEQLIALADQKGAPYWKAFGMSVQGCVLVANGDTSGAVQLLTSGMTALRSTGATLYVPWLLSNLARAYVDLAFLRSHFDVRISQLTLTDAKRSV